VASDSVVTRQRIVLAGLALGVAGVALAAVLLGGARGVPACALPEGVRSLDGVLAQIDLSAEQRGQIDSLRRAGAERLARLERSVRETADALRRAEVAEPFDGTEVGTLVWREAEAGAYVRGAESELVSQIARVLTPEQRAAFVALRTADLPVASAAPESGRGAAGEHPPVRSGA
jgi:Spy/CpxP family protein refolding chaperone